MHEKYEDLLLLYMTRSISSEQLAELQIHLAECTSCRASLNEWRAISNAVQQKARERDLFTKEQKVNLAHALPPQRYGLSAAAVMTVVLMLLIGAIMTFVSHTPTNSTVHSSQSLTETPLAFAGDYIEVVIAAQPIENGAVINETDVMLYRMPVELAPPNGLTHPDDVIAHIARINIACGQIIVESLAVQNARDVPQPQPAFDANRYACADDAFSSTTRDMDTIVVVPIVVARNFIAAGSRIQFEDITTSYYLANLRPAVASFSIQDIGHRTALVDLYPGELIPIDLVIVASVTPIATETAQFTLTPTILTTATIPVYTVTPTISPTPSQLCAVRSVSGQSINVRAVPSVSAQRIAVAEADEVLTVIEVQLGGDDLVWYRVRVQTANGAGFEGWVRHDAVRVVSDSRACPLP